jgi:ABC-type multidrug transport system fused ATPase/permease subunit
MRGLPVLLSAIAIAAAPLTVTAACAGLALVLTIAVRATRARQRRGGARQFELGAALYRHVQHSLGALKEVRILGRAPYFVDAFSRDAAASARLDTTRATLDAIPRLMLETTFAAGLFALVAWGARGAGDEGSVLPLVTLYAYTGFRIIPAAHRIALHMNSLRWSLAATESLVADLRQLESAAPRTYESTRLELGDGIVARGITFTYERAAAPVLTDVSLTIRRGESIAIAGETGAGKTTLVDILLGFLVPEHGTVLVAGAPILGCLEAWHRNIGYVPQSPFLLDDTIRRNIAIGLPDDAIDDQAIARSVRAARLEEFIGNLPDRLDTFVGERGIRLSGGERQRIAIARALYRDPALIILDEATSSLDAATERDVADAIDALHTDRTVVVIAHRLTTMARCERIVVLSGGHIVADGAFADLATSNAAFRALTTA